MGQQTRNDSLATPVRIFSKPRCDGKVPKDRLARRGWPRYPAAMSRVLAGMFICCSLICPAQAADNQYSRNSLPPVVGPHPPQWRYNVPNPPPFARSVRVRAELESQACWHECSAYCAAMLDNCFYVDSQGRCLAFTDSCNLDCQRSCRSFGSGPLLPLD